jgi:transcriptional regulator with XRE-family HTH domain
MKFAVPWSGRRREVVPEPEEDTGPRVSERLREARRARGLSIADVERDIRINRIYIEAIEAEEFRLLPAPVYARGFIRAYARYLGLDPEEAADSVPVDLPRPRGLDPLPGLRRNPVRSVPSLPALSGGARLVLALILLVAVIAAGAMVAAYLLDAGADETVVDGRGVVPDFRAGETPDFTGVPRDDAIALLRDLGYRPVVVETPDASVASGRVIRQAPSPGATLDPGEVVTLFVSSGPR